MICVLSLVDTSCWFLLFKVILSSTKFDSGTAWPSYFEAMGTNEKSKVDLSIIFMPQQEVVCAVCHAHLDHIFYDGSPSRYR